MLKDLEEKYILPTYARNYTNFVSGKNAVLKDDTGKDYIDFTSGIGVVSVGHGNEKVAKAIYDQVSNITHISNLYVIEPQAKCAERIVKQSGYDMKCFFANSGAEANEGAIKIARKYGEVEGQVKRYKIITLDQSFHGRTITALKATGQEAMHNYFGPFPDGFTYAKDIDAIESMLDEHTVAVMIELVQGEGGVQPLDKQKVQALAKTLKAKDILLMVDEVQTGIYRTGEFLASNLYEIEPDVITLAKGLGGGVPIGVVMTSKKDIFKAGDHGSTFGGNYLSTAAANAVLDILESEKNSGELDRIFIKFETHLEELFKKYPNLFTQSVGFGLMRGLRAKDADTLASIIKSAYENGVLVLKAGRNTLRFLPPLTISDTEITEGFKRLDEALSSL
jgi:acetylornithine/N-succinyldiaminopimelate aminotransferase